MIGVACFAPMAIHRLLPLLEEAVHVRGNLSAGGAAQDSLERDVHDALGPDAPRRNWAGCAAARPARRLPEALPRPGRRRPMAGPMSLAGGTK